MNETIKNAYEDMLIDNIKLVIHETYCLRWASGIYWDLGDSGCPEDKLYLKYGVWDE